MGNAAIFSGKRTKLLSSKGLLLADGTIIDNDGQKNYITAKDGSSIGSWTTYADAAGTNPVDGTGGSPTVTYAVSTDSSLRGTTNFLFTHGASNQQGQGFSYDFTIDPSDKAKVLQISLEYLIASGTYADDDLQFWIYDVTNAALIQPAPFKLKNSGIIEKFAMEFQATTSTSYRLIGHVATSTATAYTIRFGNWSVGPQAKLYGSPITDWITFTPTGSWTTNTTYSGKWRRVGDSMEIFIKASLSGAPNVADLSFDIPSGYTIDTSKIASDGNLGSLSMLDSGVAYKSGSVTYLDTNSVSAISASSGVTATSPHTWASGDNISSTFKVPIQGWASSQVMSSDADTRVVAASITGSPANVTAGNPIIYPTKVYDTHGAYNTATGEYVVATTGYYKVNASINASSASNVILYAYVNGVQQNLPILSAPNTLPRATGTTTVYAIAGQAITVRPDQNLTTFTGTNLNGLSIERISGPSQIMASESVSASYNGIPTGNTPLGFEIAKYPTKIKDTHNAYNTSTGEYTVPVSGTYSIYGLASVTGNYVVGNDTNLAIFIDGVVQYRKQIIAGGSIVRLAPDILAQSIPLLAGQKVTIRVACSAPSGVGYISDAVFHKFSIVRTGNY